MNLEYVWSANGRRTKRAKLNCKITRADTNSSRLCPHRQAEQQPQSRTSQSEVIAKTSLRQSSGVPTKGRR
jgi:hypothetical protein